MEGVIDVTRGASEVPKLPSTVMERIESGSLTVEAAWTELAGYSRIVQQFEVEAVCAYGLRKQHAAGRLLGLARSIQRDVDQAMESLRAFERAQITEDRDVRLNNRVDEGGGGD